MQPATRTNRPIMLLLDLLGRRWALRILWELRGEAMRSRPLRTACGEISPTVMQRRLDELREAGLVELEEERGYALTSLGCDLLAAFDPLYRFAERWARRR